jgi:hypothetical protein
MSAGSARRRGKAVGGSPHCASAICTARRAAADRGRSGLAPSITAASCAICGRFDLIPCALFAHHGHLLAAILVDQRSRLMYRIEAAHGLPRLQAVCSVIAHRPAGSDTHQTGHRRIQVTSHDLAILDQTVLLHTIDQCRRQGFAAALDRNSLPNREVQSNSTVGGVLAFDENPGLPYPPGEGAVMVVFRFTERLGRRSQARLQ